MAVLDYLGQSPDRPSLKPGLLPGNAKIINNSRCQAAVTDYFGQSPDRPRLKPGLLPGKAKIINNSSLEIWKHQATDSIICHPKTEQASVSLIRIQKFHSMQNAFILRKRFLGGPKGSGSVKCRLFNLRESWLTTFCSATCQKIRLTLKMKHARLSSLSVILIMQKSGPRLTDCRPSPSDCHLITLH